MLRYGDGTPFPFEAAFLDMLVDVVEACTTMLASTANLDRRRAEAEAVLQAIGEEERRLVMFERAVAAACAPDGDGKLTPAAQAAERTRSAMQTAVELSREQLKQLSATKAAPPSWHRTARRVHAAAARFFSHRLLPGTRWAWSWDVSGVVPRAEAASQDARFRVMFDLDIPDRWRAPVRIDALVSDLVVRLPRPRWLRAPVETALPLGRCLLVGARHDDRGRELLIHKPDGAGWRIELPQDGQPSATALDRRGRAVGTGLVREDELAALVEAIERQLPTLQLPRHARDVLLDGQRLDEIADTTLAPCALLDELGPTVREIRQRSRMPGELTLKRDVADGVREELYISRASLTARYASLPPELRRLLDDAGFGRGLTTGIAELSDPPSQPEVLARPAPQPEVLARPSPQPAAIRPSPQPAAIRPSPQPAAIRPSSPAPARPSPNPARPSPNPADRPPRRHHKTEPLLTAAPQPAAPVLPATRVARGSMADERKARHSEDPTAPSILIVPTRSRARAEVSGEISQIVTPPLFPHVPIRRLDTPTG